MNTLIETLEAATTGSLDLDKEIGIQYGDLVDGELIPRYTTSLDAALALVPKGLFLDLHDWSWARQPCWCASLQSTTGKRIHISEKGATAALALCIAVLRARSAK